MKIARLFVLSVLLSVSACQSHAQTAASFIAQGRAFLAASNIVSANLSFSNALVISPTDPTGNVFYAATRLLVLPSQPTGGNFLTSIGIPAGGRNIYKWTARPSKDAQGIPLAPRGVSLSSATSLLRNTVLTEVIGAEANLAMITTTNFTLALTAQDTASAAVTLDYGDIQLLRSMLDGMEYFIYNTYDWNLDAQLTIIRSLYANGNFSLSGLLTDFPSLLTFATTNDLSSAKTAFVKAENTYITASQIIRNRPPGTVRLFNFDGGAAQKEANFRMVVSELASTLTNGPVTLGSSSNFSIFLPPTFTGTHPLRSFFPQIHGNGFVLGSLPDPTFGGALLGVSRDMLEKALAKQLAPIPVIAAPASGPNVQFQIHTVVDRGYVVQFSTNLLNWSNSAAFFATGSSYEFTDFAGHSQAHRFYRVVDSTHNMPPPLNDNFANRIPLTGLGIQVTGYDNNATAENNEPGNGFPSIWWSWTATTTGTVIATTAGSNPNYPEIDVFMGTSVDNLSEIPYGGDPNFSYNGYAIDAIAGTTYQIQVSSFFGQQGVIQLEISTPPNLNVSSPEDGSELPAGSNITVSASASDAHSQIASVSYDIQYYDFFGGFEEFSGSNPGSSISYTLTNAGSGTYYISETATDILGIAATSQQNVTVDQ